MPNSSEEMNEIFEYGLSRGVYVPEFTYEDLYDEDIEWLGNLFPEDDEDYDEYISEGDENEIHTKFVMYHCFMQLWYDYNDMGDNRENFYEQVMEAHNDGVESCLNASEDLDPQNNPIKLFHYYEKYDKSMFEEVGL